VLQEAHDIRGLLDAHASYLGNAQRAVSSSARGQDAIGAMLRLSCFIRKLGSLSHGRGDGIEDADVWSHMELMMAATIT
jgi:hypothetical protein